MLLEINKRVLNSVLKRFLKLLVKLFHKFEPFTLNLLFAGEEKLLVNGEKFNSDHFEVFLENFLLQLKLGFLLSHELAKFIQSTLLDLSEDGRRNDFELVNNLSVSSLEIIDVLVVLKAIASALIDKSISLSEPIEPPNTWFNEFVQG